jgi:hypothetical protein
MLTELPRLNNNNNNNNNNIIIIIIIIISVLEIGCESVNILRAGFGDWCL